MPPYVTVVYIHDAYSCIRKTFRNRLALDVNNFDIERKGIQF